MAEKRRVFVSFYGGDEHEVEAFCREWGDRQGVFTKRILHEAYTGDIVNSADAEYVIGRIRTDFLADSTVTLLLMGKCTHSRRYVDWELKATLRQGLSYTPNGLLAVQLPSVSGQSLHLPPRLDANLKPNNGGYARYYVSPQSAAQLAGWIEDAFAARTTRAKLIVNSQDRMEYNAKCKVHDVTH